MKHLPLVITILCFAIPSPVSAQDKSKVDWDAAYAKLLKSRPEIARKVESGDASKEDIIAWMKESGDKAEKGKGKGKGAGKKGYGGQKIEIKDPRGFKQQGETTVFSGPQQGEKLPDFTVIGLHGKRKGKEYNPVKVANGKPMILIFQDNQVPGQKGLLLNGEVFDQIAKISAKGLEVFSVFLVDDPTPEAVFEYDFKDRILPIVQMSISKDRRDGPGAYGLNRNLGMTIIVARDGKVLHNFPMAQPLLYPNAYVLGAIAEAIEVKPETLAARLNNSTGDSGKMMAMKMQKGDKKSDKPGGKKSGDDAAKMKRRRAAERQTDVPRRTRTLELKDPAQFEKSRDKQIFSGPQPGEQLPAFTAVSLLPDQKGQSIDIIKDTGNNPQVIVFQDKNRAGLRGLFGISDALGKIKQTHNNLRMSVVFLDDDKAALGNFAGRFSKSLNDRGIDHISMSEDGRNGPGSYGLNRNVSQTIILAKDGKVTRNFAFPQGLLYADPHVLGGIAELVDEKRDAIAKLVNTPGERERERAAMAMQNGDKADPQAAAKSRFRKKLGELVAAGKLNREDAGALWKAAFASDKPEMQNQPRKTDR